ncbi:MAG: hypothetical protein LBF94_03250 [Puniceicoccales bacterium]|jgi:hypothetical protein|nr:hypothetical protein [Puniceicoccales bacterium]
MNAVPFSSSPVKSYEDYSVEPLPQSRRGSGISTRNVAPSSDVSLNLNKREDLLKAKSLALRSAHEPFFLDYIESIFREYLRNPHSIYLINLITSLLNHVGRLRPGAVSRDLDENFKKNSRYA